MKLIALFGAAALAAGTVVTATPAEAQRGGWHHGGPDGGPGGDRGRGHGWGRGGHDWNRGRGWDRGPRWRGNYGYGRPGYGYGYGRSRVVCRLQPGYYGPVRRCFRVQR